MLPPCCTWRSHGFKIEAVRFIPGSFLHSDSPESKCWAAGDPGRELRLAPAPLVSPARSDLTRALTLARQALHPAVVPGGPPARVSFMGREPHWLTAFVPLLGSSAFLGLLTLTQRAASGLPGGWLSVSLSSVSCHRRERVLGSRPCTWECQRFFCGKARPGWSPPGGPFQLFVWRAILGCSD